MTIVNLITIGDKEVDIEALTSDEREDVARNLNRVALASIGYEETKDK